MVLAVTLLLVHVAEMRIFDRLHTSGLYLSRLRWLLTNKILHETLLPLFHAACMMAAHSAMYIF
jgi:hypothetical protein